MPAVGLPQLGRTGAAAHLAEEAAGEALLAGLGALQAVGRGGRGEAGLLGPLHRSQHGRARLAVVCERRAVNIWGIVR